MRPPRGSEGSGRSSHTQLGAPPLQLGSVRWPRQLVASGCLQGKRSGAPAPHCQVDELLYGVDYDPQELTASEKVALHESLGIAGLSSYTANRKEELRPGFQGYRKGAPHQEAEMQTYISPDNAVVAAHASRGDAAHASMVERRGPGGAPTAGAKSRQVMHSKEGRKEAGPAKARPASRDALESVAGYDRPAGARRPGAPTIGFPEPAAGAGQRRLTQQRSPEAAASAAPAAGAPTQQRRNAPGHTPLHVTPGASMRDCVEYSPPRDAAYERALEEGRAMLASPYSSPIAAPVDGKWASPRRAGSPPGAGPPAAGGFRKTTGAWNRLVDPGSPAHNQQSGAEAAMQQRDFYGGVPFGVDPETAEARQQRFQTQTKDQHSAKSTIGGPLAQVGRAAAPASCSTAVVAAAGQRAGPAARKARTGGAARR